MAGVYQLTPPAALHNSVSTTEITADKWTVIATSTNSRWSYYGDYGSKDARAALHAASDANTVILMHRRASDGWELVARLAGPAWRRFQARRP